SGQVLEGGHRLLVGYGNIFGPSGVVQVSVLGAYARVVKPGGNGVHRGDLPVLVLAEVRLHPVENAKPSGRDGSRRFKGFHAPAGRLAADEPDALVLNKMVKASNGVGAAAHAGQHRV